MLLGVNARSAKTDNISASYRGFPSGALSSPNYAEEIVSKPVSSDNSTRLIGFLGTLNYSYNDVYLLDASVWTVLRNSGRINGLLPSGLRGPVSIFITTVL